MKLLFFICSTAILIGLVCLIRTVCRKHLSPRAVYILWLPVLIRLLVPMDLSLAAPTGMARLFQTPYIWMEQAVKHITAQDGTKAADELDAYAYVKERPAESHNAGGEESDARTGLFGAGAGAEIAKMINPALSESGNEKQAGASALQNIQDMQNGNRNGDDKSKHKLTKDSVQKNGATGAARDILTGVLAAVWLLGSAILGISTIVSNRKLHRYVRGNRGQHGSVKDILPDCEADLPVVVCDEVLTPCLAGVFRPCILVSRDVMEQPDLLYYSLLHETTHYRHLDHIWTFLRVLACVVYWWNPLVWLAARLAKQDCELACDCGVIAGLEAEKKREYGMSLLKLLEKSRQPAGSICIATAMTAKGADLKRRIRGIADETKTKRYILFPAVFMLAVVFLAGCSGKADGSFMKYSGIRTDENNAVQHGYFNYVYSLQDDLKNAVVYCEVYEYGKLASRPQVNVTELEGADGEIGFGWDLETFVSEDDELATNLKLHCKEKDMESTFLIDLEAYHAGGCAGSILGENQGPLQIQGDTPIPVMGLYLASEKEAESMPVQDFMNLSATEIEEMIPPDQVVVLFYFAVSDKTRQELLDTYYKPFGKDEPAMGQQAVQDREKELKKAQQAMQDKEKELEQAQQAMQDKEKELEEKAQQAIQDEKEELEKAQQAIQDEKEELEKAQQAAVRAMEDAMKQSQEDAVQDAVNTLDAMYDEGSTAASDKEAENMIMLSDSKTDVSTMVNMNISAGKENVAVLSSSNGGDEEDVLDSDEIVWENYGMAMQWAEAFIGRNGSRIVSLSTKSVQDDLREKDLLEGQGDSVSFGYSSPWPAMFAETAEEGYRIANVTKDSAEILYYAQTSDPHVTVWKEMLTINDEKKVAGETLVFLDGIADAERFRMAYPVESLLHTPMDYQTNGLGEALNANALLSSSNYYKGLFAPETAAAALLNLHTDGTLSDAVRTYLLDEKEKDGKNFAYVEIVFQKTGEKFLVLMLQPYKKEKASNDVDSIWIPAVYVEL